MDLRGYLGLVWKWAWLLALGTALAAGAAFGFTRTLEPTYQSTTTLMVTQATNAVGPSFTDLQAAERLARTYGQVIVTRPVLLSAAQAMGLEATYDQMLTMVDVEIVRDTQLIKVSAEHPDPAVAARVANQIASEFIRQNDQSQLARFQTSKESLDLQIRQLEGAIAERTTALQALSSQPPSAEVEARRAALQRETSDLQQNYSALVRNADELRMQEARAINSVTVVEPAVEADLPVRPNLPLNTLLGAIVGLMLAVGAALLAEHLDDALRTPERVGQKLKLPTLGVVSRFGRGGDGAFNMLPVLDALLSAQKPDPQRSQAVEAFRTLHVNLRFSSLEQPLRALAVTSSVPSEGKTTTAANLAIVLAQAGTRVILADADLRRPSLHKLFELENTVGLTSLLLEDEQPPVLPLHDTPVPGLRVLTAGLIPHNPSELLGSPRLLRVMDWLQSQADLVIVDAPPVLAVSDPILLAASADGVILVVDASTTRAGAVLAAKEALDRVPARMLGVVLNKVSARQGGYYSSYHRYYQSETPAAPAAVANGSVDGHQGAAIVESNGRSSPEPRTRGGRR